MEICCCCFSSVAKSCPTLCDPVDCSLQASLSFTVSWSLLKLMSIELVIPSHHLILCGPLLLDLVKQNSCMMVCNLSAFSATLKSSPWIQASESWVPWLWHISPIHLAPPQNAFKEPYRQTFLVAQMVKNLPVIQETRIQSLGWEDPLEEGMASHSSSLVWRIPWTEEPGGLQSIESQRTGHN